LGFEQPTHAPEKFETKVVENAGIQKQFKIIKVYLTKPNGHQLRDAGEGELIQRWVMNEANKVRYRLWISSLNYLKPSKKLSFKTKPANLR
jgi:hypothetical protein